MLYWFRVQTRQAFRSVLFSTLLCLSVPAVALDSIAYIDRSVELIDESEYSLARTYLNPAVIDFRLSADARSRAYYLRGYSYFAQGLYVSAGKDYHRALEFNPENPGALAALGNLYYYGNGVEMDQALSLNLFAAAAEAGHTASVIQVGYAYLEGRGVPQNLEKAREWFSKPAVADNPRAMEQMARTYRAQYTDTPDPQTASEWYEKARAAGSIDAMVSLAYMYQMGELGEPDMERALALFKEAAEAGSINANVNLAHFYLSGVVVEADAERARSLFELAADAGNPSAFLGLGHLYETGSGVQEDLSRAINYYQQAAAADLVPAHMRLAYLDLQTDNVSGALGWLGQAAALGQMEAHNDYAWVLATTQDDSLRNGELALIHAEKAVAMKASASYLDTLAAAYAELGRFEEAVLTQEDAIEAANPEDTALLEELERHLAAYRNSQPWRE